jgi:uncharacterized OB-fold protein
MAVPNLWRTKKQRYSLQGEVCTRCATVMFPPRQICPHCAQRQAGAELSQAAPALAYAHVYALPQAAGVIAAQAAGDD